MGVCPSMCSVHKASSTARTNCCFAAITGAIWAWPLKSQSPATSTTGYVGLTPYILIRDDTGVLRALVNRCAHRGAEVVRIPRGNASHLTCIYHNWTCDQQGRLTGVTLERGRGGVGGFAADFDKGEHGLRSFAVDSIAGVVFGCLGNDPKPLDDYLGPAIVARLKRIMERPITVTGYQRHTIRANWKFLMENSRDLYHAPQLHKFFGAFGIVQPTQQSTVEMWHQGTHRLITIFEQASADQKPVGLEEPRVASQKSALPDSIGLNIIGIFPNCLFTLAGSSFSIRQLRPKTPDRFEAFYTSSSTPMMPTVCVTTCFKTTNSARPATSRWKMPRCWRKFRPEFHGAPTKERRCWKWMASTPPLIASII